jgi:hypothetical protein
MISIRLPIAAIVLAILILFVDRAFSRDEGKPSPTAPRIEDQFEPGTSTAPAVDLRPEIEKLGLSIRDQCARGTCSVFATTFLIEYQAARTTGAKNLDLSEEYLNWTKNRANKTDVDGGMFRDIIKGFNEFGMVPVADMPNRPTFDSNHPDAPAKALIASGREFERYPIVFIKEWDNEKGMSEKEPRNTKPVVRNRIALADRRKSKPAKHFDGIFLILI